MLYVALAEAASLVIVVSLLVSLIKWLIRQQKRERDLLLNQMLHLAGKPWQSAPSDLEPVEPLEFVPRRWTAAPEQEPLGT